MSEAKDNQETVRNTKSGKEGKVISRWNRTTDNDSIIEVDIYGSARRGYWKASNCVKS